MRLAAFYLAVSFLAVAAPALAETRPETTKYAITIRKVELRSTDGTWVTVVEPDRVIDLINEEPVVSFFNNGRIPEGSYVNFRLVLSETVTIAGCVKNNCTMGGGSATLTGTAANAAELPGVITGWSETAPTWHKGAAGDVKLKLDLDNQDEDDKIVIKANRDFGPPIEISEGQFVKVWFDVDLRHSMEHALPDGFAPGAPKKHAMYVMPPALIEELKITVGTDTRTFTSDQILLEF